MRRNSPSSVMKLLRVQNWNASDFAIQLQNRPSKSFTNLAGANRTVRIWVFLGRSRTASATRSSEPSRSSLAINARWRSIRRRWSGIFFLPISTVVWAAPRSHVIETPTSRPPFLRHDQCERACGARRRVVQSTADGDHPARCQADAVLTSAPMCVSPAGRTDRDP